MTNTMHSRISSLALAGLLAGTVSPSFATFYDMGGAHFEATVKVSEEYDSNIFLNSNAVHDAVTTGSATVKVVRDVALVASTFAVGANQTIFADHSGLNSFDPFVTASASATPSDKTSLGADLSYRRNSLSNAALNDRTKSNDLSLNGSLQNLFSEKLGWRLLGGYRNSHYLTLGYANVLSYDAGLDAVYVYSPKLTIIAGYNHRESWTENRTVGSGDPSNRDGRFSIGLEGELAPKVSGTFNIGWTRRTFNAAGFSDASTLYLASGLKWIPAQKTSVAIDASQDFDVTAANQSAKNTSLSVGVTQVLDDKWSVDGSFGLTHSVYVGALAAGDRRDDNSRIKGRVTYALATNVTAEFSAGYGHVDSTNRFSTYDRVNLGVALSASF